jgi:hypothetical protein
VSTGTGGLRLHHHDATEIQREEVMRSLGGTGTGCFAVLDAWRTGATRLPRDLAAQRRDVRQRILDGDTDWIMERLADGTVDPRMRDANGWSLAHMAMWVDHSRLLPPVFAAGIDVDDLDRIGRTPLYVAVMNGGSPDLVRTLLDAGADPHVETVHGATAYYVLHNRTGRGDLPFLAELRPARR